jgi:hypothetical protein
MAGGRAAGGGGAYGGGSYGGGTLLRSNEKENATEWRGWGEGHWVGISLIRRAPGTSAMYTCWLTDKCTGPMFIGYGYVHRF